MDRRSVLTAGGALAVAALAGKVAAQPMTITGKVEFEGGAPIPDGELRIFTEGAAPQAADTAGGTGGSQLTRKMDDKQSSVEFSLDVPASARLVAGKVEVVATLQRADGFLLARGSDQVAPGTPAQITMHTVMY